MALDMSDDDLTKVRYEQSQHLSLIMREIGELKGALEAHNNNRFAHNWDHNLLEQMEPRTKEWETWRAGVDRWRWFIMGGLALVAFEVPIAASVVLAVGGHHP